MAAPGDRGARTCGGTYGLVHHGARSCPDHAPGSLAQEVVRLYSEQGLSTYRVAEQVGVERQRVTRMLRRAGVEIAPRGKNRARPLRTSDSPSEDLLRTFYVELRIPTPAIGRMLGVPERRLRAHLARLGIERRSRGGWDRRDRADVDLADLVDLFVKSGLPSDVVGDKLGVSGTVILRAAHSHGCPVRPGGSASATPGRGDILLIDALYDHPDVTDVLRRHRVPAARAYGPLWERFPAPAPLTPQLLRELYLGCGLSAFQIELVTGHPSATIRRKLITAGIKRRSRGGLSPFMIRWRRQSYGEAGKEPKI